KEDAVKPTTDSMSSRFRPNRLASQPVIGRMIALATRYDVNAQVASSIVADRLPAMCGSDTLTTVVSSTSMKVANITEIAMIHGFTCLCSVTARTSLPRRTRRTQRLTEERFQSGETEKQRNGEESAFDADGLRSRPC